MKDNIVKSIDPKESTTSHRPGRRFSGKWKFPSWRSTQKIDRSSTIENGLNTIFVKAAEQRKPRSTTDISVNNSLVSLGFAVANSNVRDLYKVRHTIILD